MALSDDALLRRYVRDGSNSAFSELVDRYVNPVYSAALRQVRSASLAEEITQSVFIDLSKNATKLKSGQPLIAWLYLVTRRTAIDAIRSESRRRQREKTAVEIAIMKSPNSPWDQAEPLLDESLDQLGDHDRTALLLRYFANNTLREIGRSLGISEDAAQKRISRALDRLREIFARRGIVLTSAGLATDLSARAIMSAPAVLGTTISSSVLSLTTASLLPTHTIAMTSMTKTLIATTLLLTSGILYEAHLVRTQETSLQALRQKYGERVAQIHQADGERDIALRNLASAQKQLEEARTFKVQGRRDPAMESELESWLNRVDLLRDSLVKMPGKNIPEMKFLTSNDWLSVTLNNKLETDAEVNKALSELRNLAKMKPQIISNLSKALMAYQRANNGQPPSDSSRLRPYLDPVLSDEILSRYEVPAVVSPKTNRTILPSGLEVVGSGSLILQEKVVVDEDFDTLLFFTADGANGIQGVNKLTDALRQAVKDFSKANNGQKPVAPGQIVPYLKTPVDQAKLEKHWAAGGLGINN